jgi:antirestriction protein ArdC
MKSQERITEIIIERLKTGVVPWRRPWNTVNEMPNNPMTGTVYSGVNMFILFGSGYIVPRFLTYKQATALGGQVRGGEKALPCYYWSTFDKEKEKSDGTKQTDSIPFMKLYHLFNVSQIDGLEPEIMALPEERKDYSRLDLADTFISDWSTSANVRIKEHAGEAYFSLTTTDISMPSIGLFKSDHEYYATLFHEMIHATEHIMGKELSSNRNTRKRKDYAFNELIAEIGAAYLCAEFGIDNSVIENQAAYISNWLEHLERDSRLIIQAGAAATKAVSWMRAKALERAAA